MHFPESQPLFGTFCKAALLHIRTATPKGSVTEKMYSQSLCSIYAQYGNCGKQVLTPLHSQKRFAKGSSLQQTNTIEEYYRLFEFPWYLLLLFFLMSIYYSPGNLSSQLLVLPPAMAPLGPHRHSRHSVYVIFREQNCEI